MMALSQELRYAVLVEAVFRLKGCQNLKRDHLFRCDQIAGGSKMEGIYLLPNRLQFQRQKDVLLLKAIAHANLKNR